MYLVGEQWKHDCAEGYRKLLGSKQAVVFRWLLDLGDNQTLQAVIHDIAKIDDKGKTTRKNKKSSFFVADMICWETNHFTPSLHGGVVRLPSKVYISALGTNAASGTPVT